MKKLLSVVTLLGALAGAASAAPYVLPAPAGGALTPYDWQPVYSVEGLYSFASDSDYPDMPGIRGSLSLYSNAESSIRHQFSINAAYQAGNKNRKDYGDKIEAEMIPVTLGYNINLGITDSIFLSIGAKAGYAWVTVDEKTPDCKWSDNGGGFTYSVGAGIMVQCSDAIYVRAGYEFGRTFTDIKTETGADAIYGAHTVTFGVGCTF